MHIILTGVHWFSLSFKIEFIFPYSKKVWFLFKQFYCNSCLFSLTFGFYSLHDESERGQLTLVACGLYLETSSRNRCFLSLPLLHIWPLLVITGKNETVSVLEFFLCISLRFRNRTSSNNSENVTCDSCEAVFASSGGNAVFKRVSDAPINGCLGS